MHELAIAQSLCEAIRENVSAEQRVRAVEVEWGPLSGVVPEALAFCFEAVAPAMGLEGTTLAIRTLAARARCPGCGADLEVTSTWASCDRCGHAPVTVEGGRELRLTRIEVDDV